MAGAPIGNQNAARAKRFRAALARALGRALGGAQDNVDTALEAIAAQLVQAALRGEPWAIQEVANRFDGKPAQMIGSDDDSPLLVISRIERVIVEPGAANPNG